MKKILLVAALLAFVSGLARANDEILEPIILSEPLEVSETGCGPVEPLPAAPKKVKKTKKAVCAPETACAPKAEPVCPPADPVCAPEPQPVCAAQPEPCASLRPPVEAACAPVAVVVPAEPAVTVAAIPVQQPAAVVVVPAQQTVEMRPVKKKVWVEEEYTVEETRTAVQEELRTKIIKPKAPRLAKVKSVYGASIIVHKDLPREKTYTKKVKVKYTEPVTKKRKVAQEVEEYEMVPQQRRARR